MWGEVTKEGTPLRDKYLAKGKDALHLCVRSEAKLRAFFESECDPIPTPSPTPSQGKALLSCTPCVGFVFC